MDISHYLDETSASFILVIFILIIWEAIWKLIAMWKAGRNNHLVWYICIAIINTVGILPIIYISLHRKKSATEKTTA